MLSVTSSYDKKYEDMYIYFDTRTNIDVPWETIIIGNQSQDTLGSITRIQWCIYHWPTAAYV